MKGKKIVKIYLDTRENRLAKYIKSPFTLVNLLVGDIVFCNEEDKPILVIERKAIADYAAGMRNSDGRNHEQAARLRAYAGQNGMKMCQIYYLLEGSLPKDGKFGRMPVRKSAINKRIRDGFSVISSNSIPHSAIIIDEIADSIGKHGYFWADSPGIAGGEPYHEHVKVRKKDNMTPSVFYLCALSLIPGVSSKKASAIAAKLPDFSSILAAGPEGLLEVPGIGKVMAARIWRYVSGDRD